LEEVFHFFSNAENLEVLTPPFLGFRILSERPIKMEEGAQIEYSIRLFGVPMRWRTLISVWEPGVRFVDEQVKGPYALWHHTHEFQARGGRTIMRDIVKYKEPLGWLGDIAHSLFVKRLLGRIFDYRYEAVKTVLGRSADEDSV
jgi:ligand-binding SRPBCC domain-containing protein